MTTIAVLGGTGYAGAAIAGRAAIQGHDVTVLSRTAPAEPIEGVRYVHGSLDEATEEAIDGADVVVAALSPRGDNQGNLAQAYQQLASTAADAGATLVVIGGFGSLRPAPGAPRFAEGEQPPEFAAESREMHAIQQWFATDAPANLDWVYVSPAANFGAHAPGEERGTYRIGDDVALFDDAGESAISGADFGLAVVEVIESGKHLREHISVAY